MLVHKLQYPGTALAVVAVCGVLSASGVLPAIAGTVSLNCEANPALYGDAMTLLYDGEESGTLTLKAPYGEMSLPATKVDREATDESGETTKVTGIRASGPANVVMPDKSVIESCVTGKLSAEEIKDEDIVSTVLGSCQAAAPAKGPIEIKATVEIAILDPTFAQVTVARTYLEPTSLVSSGVLSLEGFPRCTITQ